MNRFSPHCFAQGSRPLLGLVVGLIFLATACQSDCNRICTRQAECGASERITREGTVLVQRLEHDLGLREDAPRLLNEDGAIQLCTSICRAAETDPNHPAPVADIVGCLERPCSAVQTCLKGLEEATP